MGSKTGVSETDKARADRQQVRAPIELLPLRTPSPGAARVKFRWRWLVGGIAVVAVVVAIGFAWWAAQSGLSTHYSMVSVSRGPILRKVTATGTVNPVLTIIVGSYVSGVIQQLYCDYNTQVKQGQICAKIDPRPYQSVVDQSKANLAVARAQLEKDKANLAYTKVNYERNLRLSKHDYVSQDVADNARSVYEQAQAQIEFDQATIQQRQAELESAEVNLGYTDIVSPVNGTVVSRNVTMGQTVAASFQTPTLFLIATDLTDMQVDTNVSESDIGGIREGSKANFTVDSFPKRVFAGTVAQVRQSPQTVQNVVTYDVVVSVDNHDLALKPGMTTATQIIVDQRNDVIRVPNEALRYTPGGLAGVKALQVAGAPAGNKQPGSGNAGQAQLWVLRDGRPVSIPVALGLDDDSFTEIVNGDVKPGDQAIVAEESGAAGKSGPPLPRF